MPTLIDDARLSRFLLALYRGVEEQSAERFRAWAFDLLLDIVSFDVGQWGKGVTETRSLLSVYDYHRPGLKPPVSERVTDQVHTLPEWIAHAGYTITLSDEGPETSQPQHSVDGRFEIKSGLSTFLPDPVSGLFDLLSLYRLDQRCPFSEDERRFKEMVAPHLFAAYQYSLILHAWEAVCGKPLHHAAICDTHGLTRHMEASFADLLRKEWPAWRGPRLPFELARDWAQWQIQPWVGLRIVIQISPLKGLLFLQAREKTAIDTLSPRQAQVARDLARGLTYKEIAEKRCISPSTVTKHANAIYAKLGISNRTQLANLLEKAG
jgi:DNA-binding CsgD family transcriptional regulator